MPLLAARWDEPCLAPEGPDARGQLVNWSPHQAVEHAISGELIYPGYLADTLSRSEGARPIPEFLAELDGFHWRIRSVRTLALGSAAAALDAYEDLIGASDGMLAALDDTALTMPLLLLDAHFEYARLHGLVAKADGQTWLTLLAIHTRDHAQQLRAAASVNRL